MRGSRDQAGPVPGSHRQRAGGYARSAGCHRPQAAAQDFALEALDKQFHQGPFHGSGRGGGGFTKFFGRVPTAFSRTIGGTFDNGGAFNSECGAFDGDGDYCGFILTYAVVPYAFRRALSRAGYVGDECGGLFIFVTCIGESQGLFGMCLFLPLLPRESSWRNPPCQIAPRGSKRPWTPQKTPRYTSSM